MPEERKPAPLPPVAPVCPRCAALESDVARLCEDLREMGATLQAEIKRGDAMGSHQDAARALLRELAIAATVYQDSVDSGLDARLEAGAGLSEVLRRVEAEAGEVTR